MYRPAMPQFARRLRPKDLPSKGVVGFSISFFNVAKCDGAHLDTATNGSESVPVTQTSESAVSPISNRQRVTGSNACGFRDRATPENWFFHQVASIKMRPLGNHQSAL